MSLPYKPKEPAYFSTTILTSDRLIPKYPDIVTIW